MVFIVLAQVIEAHVILGLITVMYSHCINLGLGPHILFKLLVLGRTWPFLYHVIKADIPVQFGINIFNH